MLARAEGSNGLASKMAHSPGWQLLLTCLKAQLGLSTGIPHDLSTWQAQGGHGSWLRPEEVSPKCPRQKLRGSFHPNTRSHRASLP